jgi:chromosome segregation ATPase
MEANLKVLQTLFIIVLFATPLYADQALVLTEIEQIQEKIWYLQKDLAAQKTSFKKQQKQLESLSSGTDEGLLALNERLSLLADGVAAQQKNTQQIETRLDNLDQTLTTLTNEIVTQNGARQEYASEIGALEKTLQALQAEYSSNQARTEQALAETGAQLDETRSQLQAMGQEVGSSKQIWLWVAVAALVLAVVFTISLSFRKKSDAGAITDLKQPPKHEM